MWSLFAMFVLPNRWFEGPWAPGGWTPIRQKVTRAPRPAMPRSTLRSRATWPHPGSPESSPFLSSTMLLKGSFVNPKARRERREAAVARRLPARRGRAVLDRSIRVGTPIDLASHPARPARRAARDLGHARRPPHLAQVTDPCPAQTARSGRTGAAGLGRRCEPHRLHPGGGARAVASGRRRPSRALRPPCQGHGRGQG